MLRDQSEDRGRITHIVAFMPAEGNKLFRNYPWKVFDLRINPTMRGLPGRASFSNAEAATHYAVEQEELANQPKEA